MSTIRNVVNELQNLKTIDYAHAEIHKGNSFVTSIFDEDMGDNEILVLCFKTPTDKEFHMTFNYAGKLAGHVEVLSAASWSGGQTGTQVEVFNRNQTLNTESTVKDDWTVVGVFETSGMMVKGVSGLAGTKVWETWNFAAKNQGGIPGNLSREEFILAPDTKYAVKYHANAASNAGYLELNWYEETV